MSRTSPRLVCVDIRMVWNAWGAALSLAPRRSPHHPTPSPAAARSPAATRAGRPQVRPGFAATAAPEAWVVELADAESVSYSSTISRSSIARSLIDWTRWSGLLARQRRMRRRSSAGALSLISSTGTGFSLRILCIVSMPVSAAKGFRRVAAS